MLKKNLISYFLDKPGTYDQGESNLLQLNVASKKAAVIRNGNQLSLELYLDQDRFAEANKKLKLHMLEDQIDLKMCRLDVDTTIDEDILFELLDLSYESVYNSLPDIEKNELLDLEW